MEEKFPVFDPKVNYAKDFEDKYARTFELPTVTCLRTFFHPTLRDHIVTLNQINFPKVSNKDVDTLIHNRMNADFENKIRDAYMERAQRKEARRRKKVARHITLRKDSMEEGSLPEEPATEEWTEDSEMIYEGGDNKNTPKTKTIKQKQKKKRFKVKRENEIRIVYPPKIPGTYSKVKSKEATVKQIQETSIRSEKYNRAVDMYIEEKNTLFSYQDYDETMQPDEPERDPQNYFSPDDPHRIDEYIDKRIYNDCYLNFSKVPELDGMNYLPPLFRHKYELCIWRVDTQAVVKIKNSYFTPDVCLASPEDTYISFDAQLSLGHQTMLLTQNRRMYHSAYSSTTEKCVVLIFDLYTLDKIVEFTVNTCNPALADFPEYEQYSDFYNSEYVGTCKTKYSQQRVTCWNDGKYVLVGVGAYPQSKVIYEFRIYNTETMHIIGTFNRQSHPVAQGLLYDMMCHEDDPDKLVLVFRNITTYTVVEADMLHNSIDEICEITDENIHTLEITEDFSRIYIIKFVNRLNSTYGLFSIEYGANVDFTKEIIKPDMELGIYIIGVQLLGNSIVIQYEKMNEGAFFCIFNEDSKLVIENPFESFYPTLFSWLEGSEELLCIGSANYRNNGVHILSNTPKRLDDTGFPMMEDTLIKYKFPLVAILKGGLELIWYNVVTKKYVYIKLPSPFAAFRETSHDDLTIEGLLDLGKHFAKTSFYISDNPMYSYWYTDLTYIEKDDLPTDKLVNYVGCCRFKYRTNNDDDSYILLFKNSIVACSKKDINRIEIKKSKYNSGEVSCLSDMGLIMYKKNSKKITLLGIPVNFTDKTKHLTLYETNGLIKKVIVPARSYYYHKLLVVDEAKYIKEFQVFSGYGDLNKVKFEKIREYYVDRSFSGDYPFVVKDMMYFDTYGASKMQIRGSENENLYNYFPPPSMMYYADSLLPTERSCLYIHKKYQSSGYVKCGVIVPNPVQPVYPISFNSDMYSIRCEFFTYSASLDEEFIVHVRSNTDMISLDLYKSTGEYIGTKDHKAVGVESYSELRCSPNGKYLYYKANYIAPEGGDEEGEQSPVSPQTARKLKKNKKDPYEREYYQYYRERKEGFVAEISLVRRRSEINKIQKQRQKVGLNPQDNKKLQETKEKIMSSELMVDLKVVRVFKDINKYFGEYSSITITDLGSLANYDYTGRLFYEKLEITKFVENKLGTNENLEKFKITDYRWVTIKAGFIAFKSDQAYFVKIDAEMVSKENLYKVKAKPSEVIPIDFIIGTANMEITDVYECNDPSLVIFVMQNGFPNYLFVVWSLVENCEVRNYSYSNMYSFIRGKGSETGYLLTQSSYVNLDNCLPNYYFDYYFNEYQFNDPKGYKMSKREEIVLLQG